MNYCDFFISRGLDELSLYPSVSSNKNNNMAWKLVIARFEIWIRHSTASDETFVYLDYNLRVTRLMLAYIKCGFAIVNNNFTLGLKNPLLIVWWAKNTNCHPGDNPLLSFFKRGEAENISKNMFQFDTGWFQITSPRLPGSWLVVKQTGVGKAKRVETWRCISSKAFCSRLVKYFYACFLRVNVEFALR